MRPTGIEAPELSAQDLMNNTYVGRKGCRGGQNVVALQWILENGICTDLDCPYKGKKSLKISKRPKEKYFIDGWKIIEDEEKKMEEALEIQPVMISIPDNEYIHQYKTGLMDLCRAMDLFDSAKPRGEVCSEEADEHTVLLVARGHIIPDGWPHFHVKFWHIKNQWNVTWGERGFGNIIYNSSLKKLKQKIEMDESNCMWFYSPVVPLMNKLKENYQHRDKINVSLNPGEIREQVEKELKMRLLILFYCKRPNNDNPKYLDAFKLIGGIYEHDEDIILTRVNLTDCQNADEILGFPLNRTPILWYFPSQIVGDRTLQDALEFPKNQELSLEKILDWMAELPGSASY